MNIYLGIIIGWSITAIFIGWIWGKINILKLEMKMTLDDWERILERETKTLARIVPDFIFVLAIEAAMKKKNREEQLLEYSRQLDALIDVLTF